MFSEPTRLSMHLDRFSRLCTAQSRQSLYFTTCIKKRLTRSLCSLLLLPAGLWHFNTSCLGAILQVRGRDGMSTLQNGASAYSQSHVSRICQEVSCCLPCGFRLPECSHMVLPNCRCFPDLTSLSLASSQLLMQINARLKIKGGSKIPFRNFANRSNSCVARSLCDS